MISHSHHFSTTLPTETDFVQCTVPLRNHCGSCLSHLVLKMTSLLEVSNNHPLLCFFILYFLLFLFSNGEHLTSLFLQIHQLECSLLMSFHQHDLEQEQNIEVKNIHK